MEKRSTGSRLMLTQCANHVEYLLWFHGFLAERGYCAHGKPLLKKRIGKGNRIYFHYHMRTWTFGTLDWLHEAFYGKGDPKRIPSCELLDQYLTPLALAVWVMDDGACCGYGFKFCTHAFLREDLERLILFLGHKYQLQCTLHKAGAKGGHQWFIYVKAASLPQLRRLVEPHMTPSMLYKLGKI